MSFYNLKNQTDTSAELYIYGDILDDSWKSWYWDETEDVFPSNIKEMLDDVKGKDIDVYINSGGGHISAGLAISHMLQRHDGKTTGHVDGIAASIASVILMGCSEIVIPSDSLVMIHKPINSLYGNADEHRKMADDLDRMQEGILNAYKRHLKDGVEIETINQLINEETWLHGDNMAEYFNVTVTDSLGAVACDSNLLDKYKNLPKNLRVEKITGIKPFNFSTAPKESPNVEFTIFNKKINTNLNNEIEIALALADVISFNSKEEK